MLEFSKLTLNDAAKVRKYSQYSNTRICDHTVGAALMWRDYFSVEYAEYNETIIYKAIVKYHNGITAFSFPLGKDVRGSIGQIAEYCRHTGIPVAFCTVTSDDLEILKKTFGEFQLFKEANWSDYIYNAVDLTSLAGRKFSGQRNHINFFIKNNTNASFEEISASNIGEVKGFYDRLGSRAGKASDLFAEEHRKTIEVLENFDTYGLAGGLLRAGGSVVAFSIGEVVNNVLFIHIEKADMGYRGAYQVINNEFAKHFASNDVCYINREEDVGDEGLRNSKNSYHPCEIIEKYILIVV